MRDGAALVEAAQRRHPEVIVADISMPVKNGLTHRPDVHAAMVEPDSHPSTWLTGSAPPGGSAGAPDP